MKKFVESQENSNIFLVTQVESSAIATKKYFIFEGDPNIVKEAPKVFDASFKVTPHSLQSFSKYLSDIKYNECLIYGIPNNFESGRIVTKAMLENAKNKSDGDVISRSKENFKWSKNSFFPIDIDDCQFASLDNCYAFISRELPILSQFSCIIKPSSSSYIYNLASDTYYKKLTGVHLYFPYKNLADQAKVSQFAKYLELILWQNGCGKIIYSKGRFVRQLCRTLIDTSIYSPERLDFIAPAVLGDYLVFKPLDHIKVIEKPNFIDFSKLEIPPIDEIVAELACLKNQKKLDDTNFEKEKKEVREKILKEKNLTSIEFSKEKRKRLEEEENFYKASKDDTFYLPLDFELITADHQKTTVEEILSDPFKWDRKRFCDPLEPTYNNDSDIAIANLLNVSVPNIFSFAHGATKYYLPRLPKVSSFVKGQDSGDTSNNQENQETVNQEKKSSKKSELEKFLLLTKFVEMALNATSTSLRYNTLIGRLEVKTRSQLEYTPYNSNVHTILSSQGKISKDNLPGILERIAFDQFPYDPTYDFSSGSVSPIDEIFNLLEFEDIENIQLYKNILIQWVKNFFRQIKEGVANTLCPIFTGADTQEIFNFIIHLIPKSLHSLCFFGHRNTDRAADAQSVSSSFCIYVLRDFFIETSYQEKAYKDLVCNHEKNRKTSFIGFSHEANPLGLCLANSNFPIIKITKIKGFPTVAQANSLFGYQPSNDMGLFDSTKSEIKVMNASYVYPTSYLSKALELASNADTTYTTKDIKVIKEMAFDIRFSTTQEHEYDPDVTKALSVFCTQKQIRIKGKNTRCYMARLPLEVVDRYINQDNITKNQEIESSNKVIEQRNFARKLALGDKGYEYPKPLIPIFSYMQKFYDFLKVHENFLKEPHTLSEIEETLNLPLEYYFVLRNFLDRHKTSSKVSCGKNILYSIRNFPQNIPQNINDHPADDVTDIMFN